IAFISLITSVCVILITYGFYGEVSKANKTDVALASFIAFFYASLRIIAFITKMVFTSRVTASLGVRQSLFITPCAMVLLAVVIVLAGNLSSSQKIIFYLFGACSMVVDVLRTSLNSPVLLTLMQPLPTYERLRAHNIVKGIMDPFASLFAGVFLLGLVYTYGKVDLMLLCYVLVALGVLWVAGVLLVNRQYVQILIKTISNRYFSREEFNLHDDTIKEMVKDKMMTGTDQEVISILRMLNSEEDKVSNELISQLLFHQSHPLKLEALRLLKESSDSTRAKLEQLLQQNTDSMVRQETVRAITRLGREDWNLDQYIEQPGELREAAIAGMLVNKDQNIRQKGQAALDQLFLSPEAADKIMLITILETVKDEYSHPNHSKLILDPDPAMRIAAINAVGKMAMKETLEALAKQLTFYEKQVLTAFQRTGTSSLPVLERELFSDALPPDRMEKLISLCGRIGGEEAARILLKLLESRTPYTSPIVKALHRCRFVAGPEEIKLLEPI
ncbi:MAG TPA: HEAT repeat domain-containing protein, partial [Chitinophagaceae bacterium]|nr:HEAT repeat domain-containing protein [Chitinophagaceae bacterium]